MAHLYRCTLTLLEATFFSSREISTFYQTEPLLGNFALAYALELCQSPYFNDGTIHYAADLRGLNAEGVYVTPGPVLGAPRFTLQAFNAQTDSYLSAMGQGYLAAPPEGGYIAREGANWYTYGPKGTERKKLRASNRPQYGRIRALAIGTRLRAHVISAVPLTLPGYIRLGKFMSKARVEVEGLPTIEEEAQEVTIAELLNPADLPPEISLHLFDLINVPPVPLVQNAVISGPCYRLPGGGWLPRGMRFAT
ncbi:MAG TPA: type I-D CRISPR-associated protein Cas5/Csc1 [Ardenticatenaceae bacterium]|nr:type I-D CRISPR-associated protein Cas5/Csc1 [Ardenticatenaceae bacterium]